MTDQGGQVSLLGNKEAFTGPLLAFLLPGEIKTTEKASLHPLHNEEIVAAS